jgi:hypothetical protein
VPQSAPCAPGEVRWGVVRQRLTVKVPKEHYTDLERLAQLIGAGQLTSFIDKPTVVPSGVLAQAYALEKVEGLG